MGINTLHVIHVSFWVNYFVTKLKLIFTNFGQFRKSSKTMTGEIIALWVIVFYRKWRSNAVAYHKEGGGICGQPNSESTSELWNFGWGMGGWWGGIARLIFAHVILKKLWIAGLIFAKLPKICEFAGIILARSQRGYILIIKHF